MQIEPMRDMVVVRLLPERERSGPVVVIRQARAAVREAEILGRGPECWDLAVGQRVLVNLLTMTQVGDCYLVPEPSVLGMVDT